VAVGEPVERENPTGSERRRARRLTLIIRLEVEWNEPGGGVAREQARAKNVDTHGALLDMKRFPRLHTEVTLKNLLSGEVTQARVQAIRRSSEAKLLGVAVELLAPSETFWGLTFQLQRATAQLLEIERALQGGSEGIDFRVLRELRVAVEDLRSIASAVHQWQDLQAEGRDAYSVLPMLAASRVSRATNLLEELTADLDGAELTIASEGLDKFLRALERVSDRVMRG
jgi:hypothetical protein